MTSNGEPGADSASRGPASSQVCDRCRWKKIKCDAKRPTCSNCIAANLPCHSDTRLTKRSHPKSYVQNLEERIRVLEDELAETKACQGSGSGHGPSDQTQDQTVSAGPSKRRALPDEPCAEAPDLKPAVGSDQVQSDQETILLELGRKLEDKNGAMRWLGSSSGIHFVDKVLHEYHENHSDGESFSIDDLCGLDSGACTSMSQEIVLQPTSCPPREDAETLVSAFFKHTERRFPVLHRKSFMDRMDELYADDQDQASQEFLCLFFHVLAVGWIHANADAVRASPAAENPLRYLFAAKEQQRKMFYSTNDRFTYLQSLTVEALLYILLGEQCYASRTTGAASMLALGLGMHRSTRRFTYGPLENETRKRVFWCIFHLDVSCAGLSGLPRVLHEVDLDVEEPLDIDDECLTPEASLPTLPGVRSKISSFILICRLSRILSRSLDTLYTTTKRAHATSKIKEMSRICCEHLLNQWQATQREHRSQIQHSTSEDETYLVTLASLNEGLLYDYLRWLIYRPGLVLQKSNPQFKLSLDICAESAASMIETAHTNVDALLHIRENPGAQMISLWIAALTILYRVWHYKENTGHESLIRRAQASVSSCLKILQRYGEERRTESLQQMMGATFGEVRTPASQAGSSSAPPQTPFRWESSFPMPEDMELDGWHTTIHTAFGDLFQNS